MIPDPNIQVNISKVVTCKNMTERLWCCVQQNYNVTWITSSSESCSKAGHTLFITDEQTKCVFTFQHFIMFNKLNLLTLLCTVQENGCIYCDYRITENECRASDLQVTVTCKLTESDYSKSFSVSAVNKSEKS